MYDFALERPTSLGDAVAALAAEDAQALAGGQTLIPTMKNRLASPGTLVSLMAIDGMQGVISTEASVSVKGATTHAAVAESVAGSFPALAGLAGNIGDPAVRNRGTIGGSLANNDPSACYPAAVLATGATIVTNSREISAAEFFTGMFETALEHGEVIVEVRFAIPDAANYQKFEQPASRFAMAGAFVARFGEEVRVAITGVAESGVFRWAEAERALYSNMSRAAVDGLSLSPDGLISDIHGSAEYRAHLAKVMTGRAVAAC